MAAFRSELTAYRGRIASGPDDSYRVFILGILDRWLEDPDTEKTWQTLGRAAPQRPTAGVFILEILRKRLELKEIEDRVSGFPKLETETNAQASRHLKADEIEDFAFKKLLLKKLTADKLRLLGRKPKTAPKQLFMRWCTEMFKGNCGAPLDDVTATLTRIAFDDPNVTAENVRAAAKQKDRSIRKRK